MPKTQSKRLVFAKVYRLCYSARPIGASGVFWPTFVEVKATNLPAAIKGGRFKLRKTHDIFSFMAHTVKA